MHEEIKLDYARIFLAGVSLVGEQERPTTWVLYTINKKGPETKRGVKRCFEDQSYSAQSLLVF